MNTYKESIPPNVTQSTPPKKKTEALGFGWPAFRAPFPPNSFSTRHACPVLVLSRHAFGTRFPRLDF